jgi:hypothetical protein
VESAARAGFFGLSAGEDPSHLTFKCPDNERGCRSGELSR